MNSTSFFTWLGLIAGLNCAQFVGAQPALPPGEYLTEGGVLTMKPEDKNGQAFAIGAQGTNGHTCSLSGKIHDGRAVLQEENENSSCTISFTAKNGHILVDPEMNDACHSYCGMRAWFAGEYEMPVAGCDSKSLQKTRNRFKTLYDHQDYGAAETLLAPVLQQCKRTLDWLEDIRIRNDLALTLAKMGSGAGCQEFLKPLIVDISKLTDDNEANRAAICNSDDTYLPPQDCDNYLAVIRSAKVNLKWCMRAKKAK